ncbi:MAG: hypothetical protein ACI9PP_000551 [Halobacteriales archaeon]|jgi:hypothetical protein
MTPTPGPLGTAESFLFAVRGEEDPTPHRERLAALDPDRLAEALTTRAAMTAFWLDVYNAVAQQALRDDPSLFEARFGIVRPVFRRPLVTVAGHELSLDDIEHGVLRGSQLGWGLGYLPDPFPSAFERKFRVSSVDPRIHFALNCGATSCPPIAVYRADEVDAQLDLATESYLETEATYDAEANVAFVPRHMLWYRGDFGGGRGIRAFLRQYGVIPDDRRPRIRYRSYDWALDLGRFRELQA